MARSNTCIFILSTICTNKCTNIYFKILNYITDAPTCFDASAQSSGSFDIAFGKVININPLNPELNPICCLLALLGANHFLHVSRIKVKSLTFRLLMSYIYIYMEHPFLMFLDHTQGRTTVGRTPLDE